MFCPFCGSRIETEDSDFCSYCGHPLDAVGNKRPSHTQQHRERHRTIPSLCR
ncbi:zinc-ribbon domain-containing protein [Bifidobacterium adolescentis]|uniref:zinc-ribbon domain-containing protein n=1 Tax=Bifidobacterium adolescentis TaxID=1680 RepID=UPI002A334E32|nr:zinc-ribbon domain-containing protein [Bifidobacterium adolescentis]MDB1501545.1 zinc-ribbon domain-containing protein [Bifidobacterium adolescentis]